MLPHSQVLINAVKLRTVAQHAPGLVKATRRKHIVASHIQFARVRALLARQALERGCLTGACHPQQSETLTIVQGKAQIIHCLAGEDIALGQFADGQCTLFLVGFEDSLLFFLGVCVIDSLELPLECGLYLIRFLS